MTLAVNTNTEDDFEELMSLVETIKTAGSLSDEEELMIIESVENNMIWLDENLVTIDLWLKREITTTTSTLPPTTTSQRPTETTETTTLGSSSVVASLVLILFGLAAKIFV